MPKQFDDLKRRVRREINSRKHGLESWSGGGRFDKFTDRARRVLRLAQAEAQRLNHNYIGTEHLLLGLLREGEGVAAKVLARLGVRLEDVRAEVEHIIGRGDHIVVGELHLTPRAKKVFELAVDEALRMGHHYIGTEHLLLGMLREGEGIAAKVLEGRGLRLEQVRAETLAELACLTPEEARAHEVWESRAQSGPLSGPKNNVITCRLDDRAVEALDALVEAGIRSTRSDAAAWLIDAGVEAHRPLFDRVEATIAEIRRLRAEAQQIARQVTVSGALMDEATPAEGQGGQDELGDRSAPASDDVPDEEAPQTPEG
jgi:ATP-dependent Clp protease ATP-binding subunit ClpA